MHRRVGNLLSIAAFSAAAFTTPAVARAQPPGDQPQLSGSARLTGRVVAADNGRPVRRATVSLSGLPDSQRHAGPNRVFVSRKVETDSNGRFEIADLPSGSYSINVAVSSGFVRPARSTEATVAEGRTVEMTVRLERTGAITGRIRDENGEGVLGAEVHAVRKLNVGGHTSLAPSASATTNDLGEYRLFNLPAGEYYVLATHTPPQWRNEPAPRSGYAHTYYPGAQAIQAARVLVVRSGRDSERVNFTIAACQLARLSISPVDSRGMPLGREAQMILTRRTDVFLSSSSRYTSRREAGTFLFDGLQPGDYYLVVTTNSRMEEAAYVNVSIDESDVSLRVQTNTGAKVSGRILVDGQPAGSSSRNVWVSSRPPLGQYGVAYAHPPLVKVEGTDRFELTGLRGPMVLSAEAGGGALVSIQRRGEELASKTVEYVGTETLDDVVVELTTQVTQVDVTVTSANPRGESEPVLVVLFSEDPKRWHQGFIRYSRTTTSPKSGGTGTGAPVSTELIRLPPGRYLVAAVPDLDVPYPTQGGVFEKLRPFATPVTLVAGQRAKVTVGVTNREATTLIHGARR